MDNNCSSTASFPVHFCTSNPCPICHPACFPPPPARTPHRCPVCEGRGNVPAGFYEDGGFSESMTAEPRREPCRSCIQGVVWS